MEGKRDDAIAAVPDADIRAMATYLASFQTTVIFSTHNIAEAERYAEEIAWNFDPGTQVRAMDKTWPVE